jgi:hypothetical protein
MRRIAFILAIASVCLATAGIATGTHSEGNGGPNDLVAGTGQFVVGVDVFLHVNALSGPLGEDPRGHLVFRAEPPAVPIPFDLRGEITCMRVIGNAATVSFRITASKAFLPPTITGGLFSIVDNGEGGAPDQFEGFPLPAPLTTCPPPFGGRPIERGNFVIHDALP